MPRLRLYPTRDERVVIVADFAQLASLSTLIRALVSDDEDGDQAEYVDVHLSEMGDGDIDVCTVEALVALASENAGPTWDLTTHNLMQLVKLCQWINAPSLCGTVIRTLAHRINSLRSGSEDERFLRGLRS